MRDIGVSSRGRDRGQRQLARQQLQLVGQFLDFVGKPIGAEQERRFLAAGGGAVIRIDRLQGLRGTKPTADRKGHVRQTAAQTFEVRHSFLPLFGSTPSRKTVTSLRLPGYLWSNNFCRASS